MQTLYASEQTRKIVIAAYQAANVPIGWQLRGSSGVVFNPTGSPNQFSLSVNVANTLTAINPNTALLITGNTGLAATNNGVTTPILTSTFNGQLADDYVAQLIISNVVFNGASEVQG